MAATLYNLLTGKYVFDFPCDSTDQMLMILECEPVPIQSRRSDIPNGLAEVIHRALAKEPGKHFAGVKEMRRVLFECSRVEIDSEINGEGSSLAFTGPAAFV